MIRKLATPVLALMLAFGAVTANTAPAEAGGRGGRVAAGIAAGILGLAVLGAYAHARDRADFHDNAPECYPGPKECGFVDQRCFMNSWGEEVCRGGRWTCWRDTVCD
jgi:hypothetical protein